MIYTSYFAHKKIGVREKELMEVCVSLITPQWLPQLNQVKILAPSSIIFTKLKNEEITKNKYLDLYEKQILSSKGAMRCIHDLIEFENDSEEEVTIVLCCYEKEAEFCHRTRLAKIINEIGGNVVEL